MFVVASLYLVFHFFHELFTTPVEKLGSALSAMDFVIDLLLTISVVAMGVRTVKAIPRGAEGRGMWITLATIGCIAAIGLWGVRLAEGSAEHKPAAKLERSTQFSAPSDGLTERFVQLREAVHDSMGKAQETRWNQTKDARELGKLNFADLDVYRKALSEWLRATDEMIRFLDEPRSRANRDRLLTTFPEQGDPGGDPEPWRLLSRVLSAEQDMCRLVAENWEEWRVSGIPVTGDLNPWQQEVRRIGAELKSARSKLHERLGVSELRAPSPVESNKLAGSKSPKANVTAQSFLETEEARRVLATIGNELRGATGYLEFGLRRTNVSITAVLLEQPDSPQQFTYSQQGGLDPSKLGSPLHNGFKKDWLFTLAELEPSWPLLDELKRKSLDRLRLSGGTVERVTFYRNSVFYPTNRKVLVEIWVDNPDRENGRVVYDLQGAEIDVVGGRPISPPVPGREPGLAALRPLGVTDATPERVAKFDTLFASYLALAQKCDDTRWGKMRASQPESVPNLPRKDFSEWAKAQRELFECATQLLKVYSERTPPSAAIASLEAAPHARTREFWESQRQVWKVSCEQSDLLDKNWTEWIAKGFPEDEARYKKWQKEAMRLQSEIDAAHKRVIELSRGKDKTP